MVSTADIFKSLSSQSFLVVQAVEEEADKTIQPQRATGDSTYNLQKRPLSTADLFKKYSITDEAEDIGGREEVHGQEEDDLELVHIHEPEIVKTTRIYDRFVSIDGEDEGDGENLSSVTVVHPSPPTNFPPQSRVLIKRRQSLSTSKQSSSSQLIENNNNNSNTTTTIVTPAINHQNLHDDQETFSVLRRRLAQADRDLNIALVKPTIRSLLGDLVEDVGPTFDQARKIEHENLDMQVSNIRYDIQTLTGLMENPRPGGQYIQELKNMMQKIEVDVVVFKNGQKEILEKLYNDEKKLSYEINFMEEKIKNMDLDAQKSSSSLFPSCSSRISATTLTTSSSGLLPQVIEFQNYLAKHGGHYGGWDDLSHAAFVRIREKLGCRDERFIPECVTRIPDMTEVGIMKHDEWYKGYMRLLSAKKLAIKMWKERKNAEAAKASLVVEETIEVEDETKKEIEKREREAREESRKKLEEWKTDLESKKAKETAERLQREKEAEAEKERKWKIEHERKRIIAEANKRKRIEQQTLEKIVEEQELRRKKKEFLMKSLEEIEKFHERDRNYIEKVKDAKSQKEKDEEDRLARIEKLKIKKPEAEKNPERLLLPTKVITIRMEENKKKDEEGEIRGKFSTPYIPKRHVPNWRKGA